MTREEKYPETSTFWFLNANPKKRITDDCVARAITHATGRNYDEVVSTSAQVWLETGYFPCSAKGEDMVLKRFGWLKQRQPRRSDGTKYTVQEFCRWLNVNYPNGELGAIVLHAGGHHMTCVEPTNHGEGDNCRYKVRDIWNCTDGSVGMFWISEDKYSALCPKDQNKLLKLKYAKW